MFSSVKPSVNSQNPRKRQKRSHESESDIDAKENLAMPLPTSASTSSHAPADEKACHHEQTLRRLEPDLEAMRQLITCKMCYCFLTEPYSLACGHTYCYICLDSWLVAQKKHTCPDCRAVVKQQPNPSFIVREMTMIFANRAELLPDGDTINEHENFAREAAEKVAKDKANGRGDESGLFSGIFNWRHRMLHMPLHDPTDNVDRCPVCNWEVEGGVCSGCGNHLGDDAGLNVWSEGDSESSEEELDHELDAMDQDTDGGYGSEDSEVPSIDNDAFGAFPPIRPPVLGANSRRSRRPIALDNESDEESSSDDDDEHDPQMDSFIDDEADESGSESGESEDEEEEAQSTPHPRRHRRAPILVDSDDDEPASTRSNPVYIGSDEESESEGGAPAFPLHGRRTAHVIPSDDEDDDSSSDGINDDEPEDEDNIHFGATPSFASSDDAGAIEAAGFSPISVDEDGYPEPYGLHEHYHDTDDHDEDDRESPATAGNESDTVCGNPYLDQFGHFQGDGDEDEDEEDEESDGIRAITPENSRPVEVAQTHRLNNLSRRRPRSHPRLVPLSEPRGEASASADSTFMSARGVLRAARAAQPVAHPFQLDNTLARVNAQQRRVREGGSRRGLSGLRRPG